MMALVPMCSVVSYADQSHTMLKKMGQIDISCPSVYKACKCIGTRWIRVDSQLKCSAKEKYNSNISYFNVYSMESRQRSSSESVGQNDQPFLHSSVSAGGNVQGQLKALDSYFSKLHDETMKYDSTPASNLNTSFELREQEQNSSKNINNECNHKRADYATKGGLTSLNNYFGQLNSKDDDIKDRNPSYLNDTNRRQAQNSFVVRHNEKEDTRIPSSYKTTDFQENKADQMHFNETNIQGVQSIDETSDLFLVSSLAAINIAVFLFEIASPIKNSDVDYLSLPLIYGAKINKLILLGEWWRLLTPMFLHSGFLHVALGCWILLTFGPQVCKRYGSFTFFLIYILGGICGNLTSFIHTPELTVCGTGPVFALIGAWLVYQFQNKEFSVNKVSERLFWQAVIATALSFALSSLGRVDNWAHLGAAISGLIFGYLTCPSLEVDNASKNGQEEGIALVQQQADPCKSVATFAVSILLLIFLVFVYQPDLELLELNEFFQG